MKRWTAVALIGALACGLTGCASTEASEEEACAAFLPLVEADALVTPSHKDPGSIDQYDEWIDAVAAIDGPAKFDNLRDAAVGPARAFSEYIREVSTNGSSNLYAPSGDELAAPLLSLAEHCILLD